MALPDAGDSEDSTDNVLSFSAAFESSKAGPRWSHCSAIRIRDVNYMIVHLVPVVKWRLLPWFVHTEFEHPCYHPSKVGAGDASPGAVKEPY